MSYLDKNIKGSSNYTLGGAPPNDGNMTEWM